MDRSAIPHDKAPLFDAFDRLVNSVTPHVDLFTGESLKSTQTFPMRVLSYLLNLKPIRQTAIISVVHWYFLSGDHRPNVPRLSD
jgi:hypothetical protein